VKLGSRYPFVFLDADGTILDFTRSEGVALQQLFLEHGLPFSDEVRARYHAINSSLWRGFERGEVDKKDVQRLRFERLLGEVGRVDDPDRVNARYLQLLTENVFLVDGAAEACAALAERSALLLATNGVQWTQTRRMANSPLAPYFRFIVTSEEAGAQKPAPGFFEYALARCGYPDPSQVLMVGDQLSTDILGAADAGLATCWFNPADEARPPDAPRIDHEIHRLSELPPLLERR
jgi:2-haloacid dehalogenase